MPTTSPIASSWSAGRIASTTLAGRSRKKSAKWLWQRGGWLLVDRVSGKIALVKLPDFDAFYSEVSWYRDYAAYCGITSNGERVDARGRRDRRQEGVVSQGIGQGQHGRFVRQELRARRTGTGSRPRVTFLPKTGEKFTVNVSGRFADEAPDNDSDEE